MKSIPLKNRIRRRLFGISPRETEFDRRGFRGGGPEVRRRLEQVGGGFLHGYHEALLEDRPTELAGRLEQFDPERTGFAYEGAGMALCLLDLLTPWPSRRFLRFLSGPGDRHTYMVHIGAGWAYARLNRDPRSLLQRLHPVWGWLIYDGFGFHEGYFHASRAIDCHEIPSKIRGYAGSVFDQGLGRSLWFVQGAEPEKIATTIEGFSASRRPNLWAGVGLACTYAGGSQESEIVELLERAGEHSGSVAQGAAFAAKARFRAGNPVERTERACRILCDRSAEESARLTDVALEAVSSSRPDRIDGSARVDAPPFEAWRLRIQEELRVGVNTQ